MYVPSLRTCTLKKLRLHIAHIITVLVAFQILSMGLFVQDFQPIITSSVSPEINIINTIDEYIAEVILDHKDAVPEAKEQSKKDIQIHKHIIFKLINISRPSFACASQNSSPLLLSEFSNQYNYQFFEDITPPPPKQAA